MKRTSVFAAALLALGVAFFATGCATISRPKAVNHTPTYAVIVSVSGGQVPTDAQWAAIQKNFSELLAARGMVFVTDPTFADKLIQVLFVPDLDDPTKGTSYIVNVRNNPTNSLAILPSRNTTTYGGSYASNVGFGYMGYQPQYYGYFPDTNYGSSTYYNPPTITTPGTTPSVRPPHGHVTRPVDCPPDDHRRPGNTYAGNHPPGSRPPSDGNSGWNRGSRPEPSSSSYTPSTYSGGYSRSSDFVGPTTSYSSSSSNSSPSISFSSSDSSSSSYSAPTYSAPVDTSSSSSGSASSTVSSDVIR